VFAEPYDTGVIATDYETYAVIGACAPSYTAATHEFGQSLYVQILSRTTSLPKQTMEMLKSILTGYKVKYEDIKYIDHTNC
jgi:Lipocalin / cytosolic fatty-acid binding protein family